MYICDSHSHSCFSYDSDAAVEAMCEAAIDVGIDELCITDHFDANLIEPDELPEDHYNAKAAEKAIRAAAEKYADSMTLTYGLELGEPHELPEYTKYILSQAKFDYVIGSLHNLRGMPDFYVVPFRDMDDARADKIFRGYFDQTLEMIDFGGFNTLGHLGYPFRISGLERVDLRIYRTAIEKIYSALIKNGIALEVNTSGLRGGINSLLPTAQMIEWYRAMGGRLITVGSDAHTADVIGHSVADTLKTLSDMGFTEYTVFRDGNPVMMKLD